MALRLLCEVIMDPILDPHEYCTGGFDPEDIVISGMAGRFPECDSVGELKESLFNKKDLVVFRNTRYEKAARGLLTTDHVILNHGQVTWMTPELAPLSPNYHTTPTGKRFNSQQI
ncbi:ketoacyl_synth_N domain-containing protein [Trichonephila clavipes]|nr:ketoacyl_synth_N domain-containing protein [Trichonephila clavipes]